VEAIEQFLAHALREAEVIDLRTKSGYLFQQVYATRLQDGAVEVSACEAALDNTGVGEVTRLYVLVVNEIEWAVRSIGH
jgi:hypothetical protein